MSDATSPILSLRAAILAAVQADATLASLMGGAVYFYDEPPNAAQPVYALFGDVTAEDWSTDLDHGHEQILNILVWSTRGSAARGLAAAERLAELLDDAPLTLDGHRLVNLRVLETQSERDKDTQLIRATIRLRAVTERI